MMTEKIQLVMVKRKMSKTALAKSLNTSSSNLSHKFKRDDFRESEIKKIAEVLNCTFEPNLILNDTGDKF